MNVLAALVDEALNALNSVEPAAFLEGPRSPDWVKTEAAALGLLEV